MPKARVKADIHQALGGAGGGTTVIGGGAGTQPATTSLVTGNTVCAGLHTHQLDIASHTSNPAAHHSPVTVSNTGLSLSTQDLALNLAATSGLSISSGLMLADSIAGNGLTISGKVLAVGEGAGLTVSADAIALTTPGTLTVATSNAAAGNHTHAITSSANPNGAVSALLKSDEYGGLTLEALRTHGAVQVDQGLTAAGNTFRVVHHTHDYPHAHVVVNPTAGWTLDEQFGVDVDDSLLVRGYIVGKHALQIPDAAMICHYDGAAPYETDYTGNPTGHMGQVATVSGGVIYRPGVFGKAVQVAEATTNLCSNPSFETDTASWGWVNGGSWSRVAGGVFGGYCVRGNLTSLTHAWVYTLSGQTSGATLTVSAHLRATVGITRFYVSDGDYANPVFSSAVTAADGWTRVSAQKTVPTSGTIKVAVIASTLEAGAATIYVDAVQIEAKPYPTPYCDGSLGAGHSWSGTAHASSSSRAAARVRYNSADIGIREDAGAIALWFRPETASGNWPMLTRLFQWSTDSSPPFTAVWSDDAGNTLRAAHSDTNTTNISLPISWPALEWRYVCLTWDATTLYLYVDGIQVGSAATARAGGSSYLYIGSWYTASREVNGLIDEVLVVQRTLDADEVRAIYESDAPVFAETSTWHWRAGRNLVWADSEGLWAVDEAGDPTFAVAGTAKSWGGANLGAGDVFIGNVGQGHYLHWDDSATKLTIRGDVAITGTVSVAWADVSGKPDGAGRLGTGTPASAGLWLTGSYLGYYNGSSWPVYIGNDGKFYFSKDNSNYVKYDGSTFEVKGRIVVTEGTTVDTLPDGTTYGKVAKTIISGGYIQVGSGTKDSTLNGWHIGSAEIVGQAAGVDQVVLGTDGKITAGGGAVTLDATGLSVAGPNGSWDVTRALKVRDYNNDKVVFSVGSINPTSGLYRTYLWATGNSSSYASSEIYIQANVYGDGIGDQDARIILKSTDGSIGPSISTYGILRAVSGLYVGTSSTPSTTTGEIYASKSIGVGVSYTPGDGNIDAVGYVRGQKGLVIGDGVTAPTAASGVAFIYVDNADGDLKVRFGDGVTKVLAADT